MNPTITNSSERTPHIDEISTIALEGLIPLKALAFLKLSEIESPTEKNLLDLKKHADDILLLTEMLPDGKFQLPVSIATDLRNALASIRNRNLSAEQLKMLPLIERFYGLAE